MERNQPPKSFALKRSSAGKMIVGATVIAAIMVAGAFWFSRSKVELSKDDYAITLALYRVCNQRSEQGLIELEAVWRESEPPEKDTASGRVIRSIIADARSQQWQDAARACRQILVDQVKH
ncbi:hypothetical protein [Planctomycetes bacterium K23_9]|uniref:Uncharacterized protein n=1 Tax=Stieleria marina TaxID=1930275 RepID=A0A517NW13_9BACT|nr:hypothetical protein K239x_33120 [Planctomycetes bacterium K23_9]